LIIASLIPDDFPWLYEIVLEAYRMAKGRNFESARDALQAFRDAAEATMRGPFRREMAFANEDAHMMMRELPMIINHYMEEVLANHRKRAHLSKAAVAGEEGELS
jgi:hypothetical protein